MGAAEHCRASIGSHGAEEEIIVAASDGSGEAARAEVLYHRGKHAQVSATGELNVLKGLGDVPFDAKFMGGIKGDLGEQHLDEHLRLRLIELFNQLLELGEVARIGREQEGVAGRL